MTAEFKNLPWLRQTPTDFRELCRKFDLDANASGKALRALSNYALDSNALHRLAKSIVLARKRGEGGIEHLQPFTLGLISNGTSKLVVPCLTATAVRYGVDLNVLQADFDQVVQEAISPASTIKAGKPDAVLLALDYRGIPGLNSGFVDDEAKAVNEALAYIEMICGGFQRDTNITMIVQSVPCPHGPLFGSLDARLAGSQRRRIARFNEGLNALLSKLSGVLFDIDSLAACVGNENWFSPQQWHAAKLPFSPVYDPLYADQCMRLIGAMRGAAKKCLVLDLDNTIWGGVIGDDGLAGITLGQGNPQGEAYLAVQQMAKHLRERGIVLAVCSKNDDRVARSVFREHPDMLLREEDISVFQANWKDKASNLEAIASTLNISASALVLLDDNPAEREQVRQVLPEVGVPELPDDPAAYPAYLLAAGYFESLSFTDDDRKRANQYHANAVRAELAQSFRDINEYLASLEMTIRFAPFDATGRARIAQLSNRSNQFNLTTRRYDEIAIAAWEQREDAFTLQVRLLDKFGDNGLISVVICTHAGNDWIVDTWFMSCRVLNRRVEEAMLDLLVANARFANAGRLIGHYIPTASNGLVKDHYSKLGFLPLESTAQMEVWGLELSSYVPKMPPMKVEKHGNLH